jgi:hypothetical protein
MKPPLDPMDGKTVFLLFSVLACCTPGNLAGPVAAGTAALHYMFG